MRPWIANSLLAAWLLADAAAIARFSILSGAPLAELGFAAGYLVQVYFVILRRQAACTLATPSHIAVVAASVALPYAYLAVPAPPASGLRDIGIALGGALYFWAAISLRGSFSLFASRRRIMTGGPYAFVRHPVYLSYLIADFGFAWTNGGLFAWAIYAMSGILVVFRALQEEEVLGEDLHFRAYAKRVRWRFAPGIV